MGENGGKWCKVEQEVEQRQFRGFFGNYQHSLDIKGRVFIPSKYRDGLASCFMLTKGLDGCLVVYSMKEWDTITVKLERIPITDKAGREFVRFFFANATECEMDKQGRIGISQDLRDYAGLVKDVCFAGARNYVEVWDYGKWKNNSNGYDSNADELAEKMQKYLGYGETG